MTSPRPSRSPPAGAETRLARTLYERARRGLEPAEALAQRQRWRLVAELHGLGWGDERIAVHTRLTAFTVARNRTAQGLQANQNRGDVGG